MFRDMGGMGGADHNNVPVIVLVIISDLLLQPGICIRVALYLDTVEIAFRDHDHVCPGSSSLFLFQDADLAKFLLQKVEERLPDITVPENHCVHSHSLTPKCHSFIPSPQDGRLQALSPIQARFSPPGLSSQT